MQRIGLDERLWEVATYEPRSEALARLTVEEFFASVENLAGSRAEIKSAVAENLREFDIQLSDPMCEAVSKMVREDSDKADLIIYNLLIEPFFKVYEKKEMEKNA